MSQGPRVAKLRHTGSKGFWSSGHVATCAVEGERFAVPFGDAGSLGLWVVGTWLREAFTDYMAEFALDPGVDGLDCSLLYAIHQTLSVLPCTVTVHGAASHNRGRGRREVTLR